MRCPDRSSLHALALLAIGSFGAASVGAQTPAEIGEDLRQQIRRDGVTDDLRAVVAARCDAWERGDVEARAAAAKLLATWFYRGGALADGPERAWSCATGGSAETRGFVAWHVGERLLQSGRVDDARGWLRRAVTSGEPLWNLSGATSLLNLAAYSGRWDGVFELVDVADAAWASGKVAAGSLAWHARVRANLFLRLGLPELAAATIRTGKEVDANADFRSAELQLALATEDFDRAVGLGAELSAPADRMRYALALGRRNRDGDQARAREVLEEIAQATNDRAIRAADAVLASLVLARLELDRGEVDSAGRRLDTVESGARKTGFAGRWERTRARWALARARRGDDVELEPHQAAVRRLGERLVERWRAIDVLPSGIGFLQFVDRRNLVSLDVELTARIHGDEAALRVLLAAQAQGSFARRLEVPVPDVAAVRELAPVAGGIVAFLPAPVGSHAFVITRERVTRLALPTDFGLRPRVRAFRAALLVDLAAPETFAASAARARQVGGEIRDRLFPAELTSVLAGWRAVTFVGAGLLAGLPFECLPLGDDARSWFGTEFACAHLPSLPIGAWLRTRVEANPGPGAPRAIDAAFLVGSAPPDDVARAYGVDPLPVDVSDFATMVGAYRFDRRSLLFGSEATIPALGSVREAELLTIIAHGVRRGGDPRPAGLTFAGAGADDAILWYEAAAHLAAPPLVLLGACGAATRARPGEDGGNHLGGAFFEAGARGVAIADTDLELWSTLALLDGFHTALVAGAEAATTSPAEALRQARVALATGTRFSHPYFHSMLRFEGLVHDPVRVTPATPRPIGAIVGGALAGAVVALVWMRSRRRRRPVTPA